MGLSEVSYLATCDPNVMECWDANSQSYYYFHKKTGKSSWDRNELQSESAGATPANGTAVAAAANGPAAAPIDLSSFLTHGFNAPKEPPKKKKKKEQSGAQ